MPRGVFLRRRQKSEDIMKIIKKGNPDKKYPKAFRCKSCRCIFIADNTEYQKTQMGISIEVYKYSAKCPTCGAEVVKY